MKEFIRRSKRVWREYRQRMREREDAHKRDALQAIISIASSRHTVTQISDTEFGIERKLPGMIEEGILVRQLAQDKYYISDWKYQDAGGSWSDIIDLERALFMVANW